jgi:PepSY-associated TM region
MSVIRLQYFQTDRTFMQSYKIATRLHRWLAAIIGIQILIWFGTGTLMAILPIEKVRGEHLLKEPKQQPIGPAEIAETISPVLASLSQPPEKIHAFMLAGRPVMQAEFANKVPAILFDLRTASRISPLSKEMAISLVRERSSKSLPNAKAIWQTEKSSEYHGDVPVWRIDGHDKESARFFVDPNSGQIKPVRTGLWRLYDFFWGLHIMDWKNHENTNSIILIISGVFASGVALAGLWLFVLRVICPALRRRRARASQSISP